MFLTLNNYPFEVPEEHTPGLEMRVDGAWSIAHLKDTGGDIPFDVWRKAGLLEGWNASFEFLKAYIIAPGRSTKKEFPGKTTAEIIAACLENAKPTEYVFNDKGEIIDIKAVGEAQAFWKSYSEKKALKNPSVNASESNTLPETKPTENLSA